MSDEEATPEKIIEVLEAALAVSEAVAVAAARRDDVAAQVTALKNAVTLVRQAEANSTIIAGMQERAAELVPELERVGRSVGQQRDAAALSPAALKSLRSIMSTAGMVMRDTPSPTVLTYLEKTYLLERRLKDDGRRHMQGYVRLFAKILGDRPLNTFERSDVLKWVKTLERVPTSYGKGGKDAHKTIAVILREANKGKKPRLGETTIRKHVTHLQAFFLSAITHHKFATGDDVRGWFGNIVLSEAVPVAKERIIWSTVKLRQLLTGPVWTGTHSLKAVFSSRSKPGPWIHLDACWWLPVIALHTGARLEEIAQLYHHDLLYDSGGLPFLDLTDEGDRELKNEHSKRAVPIHPFLREIGFLDLFKAGKKGRVFSELRLKGTEGKLSAGYSQHFTKYRRELGMYIHLLDFHALRHTFITAMREKAKADVGMVATMVGHTRDQALKDFKQTEGYTHFSVAARLEALERLDWEAQGIDLSHLRRTVLAAGGPRGRVRAADIGLPLEKQEPSMEDS